MGRMLKSTKGQSMAEYAIVLTVVITAIVAMQVYVKRGLQGKARDASDNFTASLKAAAIPGIGAIPEQYEPYYAETTYTIGQKSKVIESYLTTGTVARETTFGDNTSTRDGTGTTGVGLADDDGWQGG